jgi:hypothetical protein
MDVLLKRKIMIPGINPSDMVRADRDQILIWLRATSYGLYPAIIKDPVTGSDFDVEIDLNSITQNEFKLKPNSNGFFEYTLPKSKKIVEFKFLTHKDDLEYEKMLKKSNEDIKKLTLKTSVENILDIVKSDKSIDKKMIVEIEKYTKSLTDYMDNMVLNDKLGYSKAITFLMEKSIISIDGVSDKSEVKNMIKCMPAYDAISLRTYINNNTPSLNYNIEVKKPESLGGGTLKTFLQLGDDLFFRVSGF